MTLPPAPVASNHTGWGVLRIGGDDALDFLQGQLSSDVGALHAGEGQYWSYNSPKGRTIANGVLWRAPAGQSPEAITMLVADDLAETVRSRLSMFVLRAKVTIEDVGAARTVIGIAGNGSADAAMAAFGAVPAPAHAVAIGHGATAFMLPDRRIAVVAAQAEGPMLQAALVRHATAAGNDVWRWFGIVAGVPWITSATSGKFVPQMVNWDLLGGISFQKGCYPGQEIVARMQYLGRLKERLFAFHADALDVHAATALFSKTFDAEQSCGTVVDAAPDVAGGTLLLAVAQIAAVEADDLALGTPDGARLSRRALPYDVPLAAAKDAG
jgi:folate-binding protein YgfZ